MIWLVWQKLFANMEYLHHNKTFSVVWQIQPASVCFNYQITTVYGLYPNILSDGCFFLPSISRPSFRVLQHHQVRIIIHEQLLCILFHHLNSRILKAKSVKGRRVFVCESMEKTYYVYMPCQRTLAEKTPLRVTLLTSRIPFEMSLPFSFPSMWMTTIMMMYHPVVHLEKVIPGLSNTSRLPRSSDHLQIHLKWMEGTKRGCNNIWDWLE